MTRNNLIELKFYCRVCHREILDGMIYFDHPDLGPVCEHCPQFNDGPIKLTAPQEEGEG
jgi:hypothetical protein